MKLMLIIYLGVLIFQRIAKRSYFEELLNKTSARINGLSARLLFKGGKRVLVNHILIASPIYTLSVFSISKTMLRALESKFSSFLWGSFEGKQKNKWKS